MSHIVSIQRKKATNKRFEDAYLDSTRKIGAYLTGSGDTLGSGLTFAEQKKYLPSLVGVDAEEAGFRKACNDYYANKYIPIPTTGLQLEIGLDENKEPVNLEQYVTFRFLTGNPSVAPNLESLVPNIHLYYVEDFKKKLDDEYIKIQAEKSAMKEYVKLEGEKKRLVLRLISVGADAAINSDEPEKEIDILMSREIKDNPEKFLAAVKDKHLTEKALITELLSKGMIRKVNYTYMDGDVHLGDSLEEAVHFISDPNNSEILLTLKAKLKEFAI